MRNTRANIPETSKIGKTRMNQIQKAKETEKARKNRDTNTYEEL
jgi:hypothetical protein